MVLRDHISIRKASKILNISRTTAQKWLSQGQMVEPRYPKRAAPDSILDPYKDQLSADHVLNLVSRLKEVSDVQ